MTQRLGISGRWLSAASGAQITALTFGAVTNVLYARFLGAAQIGRLAILLALAGGILLVADGGLQSLLGRELALESVSPRNAAGLLFVAIPATLIAVTALMYGLTTLAGALFSTPVLSVRSAMLLLELTLATQAFQAALALFQGRGFYSRRSATVTLNGFATLAFTAIALGLGGGFSGAVHATAAAYVVVAVIAVTPLLRTDGVARITFPLWLHHTRRASSLYGNGLLTFVTSTADVLLAAIALPVATVGYYQVIKKVSLVALAPLAAVLPLVYSHLTRLDTFERERFYRKLQTVAAGLIAVGLVVGAPFARSGLGSVFGSAYAPHGGVLIGLIAIGGLQFTHNLLGYVSASAGYFKRPLVINATVAITGSVLAIGLAYAGGLNGFLVGLAVANALGVAVAVRLTREFVSGALIVAPSSVVALTVAAGSALVIRTLPLSVGLLVSLMSVVGACACALFIRLRAQHLKRGTAFAMRSN
jgi:O-antigen/teichoic acid export membrane protein